MKKLIVAALMIFSFSASGQMGYDWKNMNPKQRKDAINNLSPAERKDLLNKFRNDMMVENLDVEAKDQDAFTKLYNEYLESQRRIKSQFDGSFNPDMLSEEEAKVKLNQSFDLGQKLLDNRKKYAEKMQGVISSKQVLKLFQTEGMMREKMNERSPRR